jgi:hypothetical protein
MQDLGYEATFLPIKTELGPSNQRMQQFFLALPKNEPEQKSKK